MRCWSKSVSLVFFLLATKELLSTSGGRQRMISTPDKPTRVFIGENVSLIWKYYQPSHLTPFDVVFGIWKSPGYLGTKLVIVDSNGIPRVRPGYESSISWAGNLSSFLAVFVLYNVQRADGNKVFGIQVEFGLAHNPLTDTVRLQVETKPTEDLPRIYYVSDPPLLRMGQNVSLNCTASGLSPMDVKWYKGRKVLASGMSKAVLTVKNITDKDWGEFLCVAKNSAGEDKKNVTLKVLPESPTILNTNRKVVNASWTLRWSAVYSGGNWVTLYTVWQRVEHVTKDNTTPEKSWLRQNVTGLMYHKDLTANTSYMFAVTAWNRWGESLLERGKMLAISTKFPDRITMKMDKTTILIDTEPEKSLTPSSSRGKESDFMGRTEAIVITPLSVILFILLLVVVVMRRPWNRCKENNRSHQDQRELTLYPFTSQEDLTSEEAHDTPDERRSVMLAESQISMSGSSVNLEQTTTPVRNIPGILNQPRTEKRFLVTAFRPKMTSITQGSTSREMPSSSRPFASSDSGSERMEQSQDISIPVIKTSSSKGQNEMTKETNVGTAAVGTVPKGAVQQRKKGTTKPQAPDNFRQNEIVTDTFERVTTSEDYLQPVDNNNSQSAVINTGSSRLCDEKDQSLTHSRPQPKPRKRGTDNFFQCKHSTFKMADQSNLPITQATTRHEPHSYQNDTLTTTPYQNALRPAGSVESPYTKVLSNTNWEVPRDHLSLFERIGGGSFGQVWKGAALDVAGAKGWSNVAVKMLKENSSDSDLRDLLSELDLLKKLEPHPNVIQLLGCFTKDVIRYRGGREFRPPLVILEFVPHGDLLGYLKKSKGETDDYYNFKSAEVQRQKIPIQQLYKFASDIARGMEFISANKLIHRDLAARNVLVGKGLQCKITDFGMARDLGKREIYVRRSNGLMPVKWMAVESLTRQVFTTESDVWSYGIVLYEIFTLGGRPYEGMTGEEVYNYVANGQRMARTSDMSSEVYNLMRHCWHEDPSKRPTFGSITSWTETLAHNH